SSLKRALLATSGHGVLEEDERGATRVQIPSLGESDVPLKETTEPLILFYYPFFVKGSSRSPFGELPIGGLHPLWRELKFTVTPSTS
ncbi:MAG: hypothetical protein KAX20_07045, partial [Candidatus Omnitrophica bacterium]|nr:hypothetical protein [Candidatus Omnitrophota bacterium]